MTLFLADSTIRIALLTERPTDPTKLTLTQVNSGVLAIDQILKSSYKMGPTKSDEIDEAPLSTRGNAKSPGAGNYEGMLQVFVEFDETGAAFDPASNKVFETLDVKGKRLWLVERQSGKFADEAWAVGDRCDVYEFLTDEFTRDDNQGYIKRTMVPLIQNRWKGVAITDALG
ncbi:hypothetical protein JT358_11570 [Micrococcales bacterium 31B]|nr:hypothetical protein [Micrococcales bacterium 31B]